MAELLKTDGTQKFVSPADGKRFSYEELKALIGAETIDTPVMPSGKCMVLDDSGKLTGKIKNQLASYVWQKEYPIEQYPVNNDETIVGDVLILTEDEYIELNREDDNEPDDFSGATEGDR